MNLHCSEFHKASDMSDEQVLADQQELPDFERGLVEVDAGDPDEVLPYTDEPFMEYVKVIATSELPGREASSCQAAAQPAGHRTSHCGACCDICTLCMRG